MKKKADRLTLVGKKVGMTQVFDATGNVTPCTVIEIQPNKVVQVKTEEKDGYSAIQLASDKVRVKRPETMEKRVTKPLRGHYAKANAEPCRKLKESRVQDSSKYEVGAELGVEIFEGVAYVDATAISKGKGYQGVIKLLGYSGGPAAHGSSFHRHAGSTGMRTTPGRNLPGHPKASQMGNEQVTVQSLKVVEVNKEDGVLLVKGAVPGPVGSRVMIAAAMKS